MPSILVSGPVRGDFASLFKTIAKAQKKGEFAAALCVGNFLGETRDAPAESAPLPVYVVTGEDAIDADLASRLAAKNVRWLGRSGCEEVAGLRVGFLGGTYDEASYDNEAPDDMSDAPHYTCDDVEHCVEINQCRQVLFTKSFLGDDVAVLARSSGEEPASPRHRAGVASMAWRTTR